MFVVVDVNSPFFPLYVPFLSADVVLEALEDDDFVVSSLVRGCRNSKLSMCIFIVVLLNVCDDALLVRCGLFVDVLARDVREFVGETCC